MSDENLIVAVFTGVLVVGIAATVMLWKVARMVRGRTGATLVKEAAARGWQAEAADEGIDQVMRYRGTTDDVPWSAEFRRSRDQTRYTWPKVARWHAASSRGPASPVLILREGSDMTRILSAARGDLGSMVAGLAQMGMDKAIDKVFGSDVGALVDATKLHRVTSVSIPHFTVMAIDTAEGERVMKGGAGEAIMRASGNSTSVLAEPDAPAVLLMPEGVHLGRRSEMSLAEVERFAKAGAAIVHALR
jgi:hypothetical protein